MALARARVLVTLLVADGFAVPATAAILVEVYSDRAAFESRLGGTVRVVGFDDIDTSAADPVAFAPDRYAASHGVRIEGEDGQYASQAFGFPETYPLSSAPNQYAPGPIASTLGGGTDTAVTFVASGPALVAGFGAVFVDPDLSQVSGLTAFDADGARLGSAAVPEDDHGLVFRGLVAVDDTSGAPTPAIARVEIVNGTGWPGADFNDGVPLDDFVFGVPGAPGASTTTTTTLPDTTTTTTSTTLCPPAAAAGCRPTLVSGQSKLVIRDRARDARDLLVWVWGKGHATTREDFGDPTAVTAYALCVYDAAGLRVSAAAPAGGTCARALCWRSTRAGFVYTTPALTPGGIRTLRLKSGTDGRARIALEARGPALALTLPLASPVTTQLRAATGATCWEARFTLPKRSTRSRFTAQSD